jgi:glycerol-3-phosphate dehydrogenase
VRPLFDDGAGDAQSATRDYVLKVEGGANEAPLLNIFGGKITTYRRLAEAALAKLLPLIGKDAPGWTADAALPGGDFPVDGLAAQVERLRAACPSCTPAQAERLVRAYGTRAQRIVEGVRGEADWGRRFGADLTQREVRYLMQEEWASTADDVLWRRSKLGLRVTAAEAANLDGWMREAAQGAPVAPARMQGAML